jgi:hypothetical protein
MFLIKNPKFIIQNQFPHSYPSSRNPPAWLGKIHGITFFTPTGTPPSLRSVGSTSRRHSSASETRILNEQF